MASEFRRWTELKGTSLINRFAAALPAIVVLMLTPVRIYHEDGAELAIQPAALAVTLAAGAAFALIIAARASRTVMFSALGLTLLSATFLPGGSWSAIGSDTVARIAPASAIAQIVIVVALILAARLRLADSVVVFGALASVVSLMLVAVLLLLPQEDRRRPARHIELDSRNRPNIYHFIFDGFSARAFAGDLAAQATPDLMGFTFFPNNRANYFATDASLPSLFTGRFFKGGAFRDFQASARQSGFRKALQEHGYTVTTYTPDRNRFWWFVSADKAVTNQELARAEADPNGLYLLLQTSLVRASPEGLRKGTLWLTHRLMPWTAYNFYKQDAAMLDRFLHDERDRPAHGQYIYFHIMLPHPPYKSGGDCQPNEQASYTSQARCASKMMLKVVARLRKLGKLESSLVIFQGDHGFHSAESDLPDMRDPLPQPVRDKLNSMRDSFDADALMQRSHALLLAKETNAPSLPMKVVPVGTQLIDISSTVTTAAGFAWSGEGRSIFSANRNMPRDWHFFAGMTRKHGLFRKRMGRDTEEGHIAHLSIDKYGAWHIHPDVKSISSNGVLAR